MNGHEGMTFIQLAKVAKFFGRGVLFFLEYGPVNDERIHTPQFRTLTNKKPRLAPNLRKLIEQVERQRETYLSLLEDMDELERQHFTPPNITQKDPQEAAGIVRKWLDLKFENHFETYRRALQAKGILVFQSNGYSGNWQIPKESPILGFTLYDPVCPVIVIKKQAWDTQQSFTLMHELGHLLLHQSSSIDEEEDMQLEQGYERDANAFAGALLIPDEFLTAIKDEERPDEESGYDCWLVPQRKNWGISTEVILRRLLDTGRLTASQYNAYRRWRKNNPVAPKSERGNRLYRYREPKHMFGDAYVLTVLDALNAHQITLAKASGYLDNLKIDDLHKLENLYAGL